MKRLFIILQYCLPHHLLSRLVGRLAGSRSPGLKNFLIRRFIKRYQVNMAEARHHRPEDFNSFNEFFTRALQLDARPVAWGKDAIVCPADGVLSAIGDIASGQLIQAKGMHYSLQALLGGKAEHATLFEEGSFATVYLAPKDYHRVHMPCDGTLREMTFVPGRLFSVNQVTSEHIPGLFTRNERVVCLFDTTRGPMAVILVGAMIVASIETIWAGQVAPSTQKLYTESYRDRLPPIHLQKGAEMGRFRLGSTAIVLFGPGMARWSKSLQAQNTVRMGQQMGQLQTEVPHSYSEAH